MALLQWNALTMGTGVDSVDEQHKELFKMLNQLMDATKQGKGNDEIGKMIDFLGKYAQTHFAHEERVMEQYHCAMAVENKQQHAAFLKDFTALKEKFDAEGASLLFITLIQQKVVNWLTSHIARCDSRLKECAQTV